MTLNKSFFINTASTITILIFATLSINAKEINNYPQDQSRESQGEVIAALIADSEESDHVIESSDLESSSQQNLPRELALAILLIAMCQLVQYGCQSQSPESAKPKQSRPLIIGLGLGYFYRGIHGNQKSNQEVKQESIISHSPKGIVNLSKLNR